GRAPVVRLGLGLSVQHPPEDPQATRFADHLAQVRAARAAGFSHVWASQHYLSAPYTYFQPMPTLGRVAAESGEMTLGTGVLLLRAGRISLRPLQQPRPPIWLAANADVGVRRAARLADAWLMNPHTTLPTLERQLTLFHEMRAALGRPPARAIPLIRECYVAPDAATALAEARPFLEGKYLAYRAWEQDKALPSGESFAHDFETLARDRFLIGDPARVREEIGRYHSRLGITDLIVRVQWPGMDPARVLRSIRLLGEEVVPRLTCVET